MSWLMVFDRQTGTYGVYDVTEPQIRLQAYYCGGPLPSSSAAAERRAFRASAAKAMNAFLSESGGWWYPTGLIRDIETSEKALAAYRVGTTLAGVVAASALSIPLLTHRQTLFGSSSGPRGDLLGRSTIGSWHGVEAKGKAPDPVGNLVYLGPSFFASAKHQAASLADDMADAVAAGTATFVIGDDHWAITSRMASGIPVFVVIDDPAGGDEGDPPPPVDATADFPFEVPEERLLQGYFQAVGDIEESLGDADSPAPPRGLNLPFPVRGIWLDNEWWTGAHADLFAARRDGRLRDAIAAISESIPPFNASRWAAVSPFGLVMARDASDAAGTEPAPAPRDPRDPRDPREILTLLARAGVRRRRVPTADTQLTDAELRQVVTRDIARIAGLAHEAVQRQAPEEPMARRLAHVVADEVGGRSGLSLAAVARVLATADPPLRDVGEQWTASLKGAVAAAFESFAYPAAASRVDRAFRWLDATIEAGLSDGFGEAPPDRVTAEAQRSIIGVTRPPSLRSG
jgi:hypothetical protein